MEGWGISYGMESQSPFGYLHQELTKSVSHNKNCVVFISTLMPETLKSIRTINIICILGIKTPYHEDVVGSRRVPYHV